LSVIGDDDTIRVRPAPKRRRKLLLAAGLLLIVVGGAAALVLTRPGIPIDTETEAQIDAAQPCGTRISRLAADPDIVVIDFPDLRSQGLTLDRVAALVEKAATPRDRVLDDVMLNEAITNCGDTIESYYYGHDYKAADLARFFALAQQDGVQLNAHEIWLKRLLNQLGWLAPGANGAIITLPAASPPITQEMRAVILHHEISHGAFYTDPNYADYAIEFWNSLTPPQRAAFTAFLGAQGYDTRNTMLMLNETQAYLIFTRDPNFFNASVVGMTQPQVDALRARFIAAMPNFWLRPMANAALPVGGATAACPAG